jgi:hypothetical protein
VIRRNLEDGVSEEQRDRQFSRRGVSTPTFGQWQREHTTSGSQRATEESATTAKKHKEENANHPESVELCQREHKRWHVDEAVVVQLNETRIREIRIRHKKCVDWSVYEEITQCCRSLETIDANQSAISQIKDCLVHRDSLLFDDAAFIRRRDEKVGHDNKSKFQSISGGVVVKNVRDVDESASP